MIFLKRTMLRNIFLLALSSLVLWVACDTGTIPSSNSEENGNSIENDNKTEDENDNKTEEKDIISTATLNVDYEGENNAVFFDFSTGTVTTLPHDFFDIAIPASGKVIANSGSYGSGVQVLYSNWAKTDITRNLGGFHDSGAVKEYTFKPGTPLYGYQDEENPLKSNISTPRVALIKVQYKPEDPPEYFKVVYDYTMEMGVFKSFDVTVVPGLAGGESDKKEITIPVATGDMDTGYSLLYIKLVGEGGPRALNTGKEWIGGGTIVPKEWDIMAVRTEELQEDPGNPGEALTPATKRSSVLINAYRQGTRQQVKAKVITGKSIDQVTEEYLNNTNLSEEIDIIGYKWHNPDDESILTNTYVIKTTDGGFAKFQPKTFAKDNKKFVMDFDYSYQSGN